MSVVHGTGSPAPRIGVTWMTPGKRSSEHYLRAVREAGGEPVSLTVDACSWSGELPSLHGLMLTGGGDIDPRCYGMRNEGLSEWIDQRRDQLEMEAVRLCLERGLPVLGVCRGMQLLNVALGGSLLQDIRTAVEHRTLEGRSSYHPVRVLPGTMLEAILCCHSSPRVNSRHHQGVEEGRLAPGLRISTVAADGIVEGLEAVDGRFLLGVQCHPERPGESPDMEMLFAALVTRARER